MLVLNYDEQIGESEEELLACERKQTKGIPRLRVRFIRLLKSGQCRSQAQAGGRIGLGSRQSQRLWQLYRQGGVGALLAYPYQGHKPRLSQEQVQALSQDLEKGQIQSLQQACDLVQQQHGLHFSLSGMHYLFKRLRIKKKTGRPQHVHRDGQGEEAFKKKYTPAAGLLCAALLL